MKSVFAGVVPFYKDMSMVRLKRDQPYHYYSYFITVLDGALEAILTFDFNQ